MALTRDQRRAMDRNLARVRERQHAAALRPTTPVPATVPAGLVADEDLPPAPTGPSANAVRRAAGTMWWAAQSPAIDEEHRERLLEARTQVLQESALA